MGKSLERSQQDTLRHGDRLTIRRITGGVCLGIARPCEGENDPKGSERNDTHDLVGRGKRRLIKHRSWQRDVSRVLTDFHSRRRASAKTLRQRKALLFHAPVTAIINL